MRPRNGARRARQRAGFTLIELLVTLAIIVVLAALSAAATLRFLDVQKQNNTTTTLNKLGSRLDNAWQANHDKFWTEPIPDVYLSYINTNLAGTDGNANRRARVIWVKLRYRQLSPMTFSEALNPAPLPPLPSYQTYLTNLGVTGSSAQTQAFESSACLLMALQQGTGGTGVNPEDLAGGAAVADFALPSGQEIPALVDAWGTPLTFARWPTGSTILNPSGAQKGFNDPDDPYGLLAASAWLGTSSATNFQSQIHALPAAGTSFRLTPLIASAGADKQLGLNTTTLAVTSAAGAGDDLYSTGQ